MKKLATVLLWTSMFLTACGNTEETAETVEMIRTEFSSETAVEMSETEASAETTEAVETTETEAEAEEFTEDYLISQYCAGLWDGSFISNSEHCASIEDGILWIDSACTNRIPDGGSLLPKDFWELSVISSDKKGSWIKNDKTGMVELYHKGKRIQRIILHSGYEETDVYKLENCIVVHLGSKLWIYNLEAHFIESIDNVIDVIKKDDQILYSDFEHKNYAINTEGVIELLDTSYIRFKRKQGSISEITDQNIIQLLKKADIEKMEKEMKREELQVIDNNFIAIESNGNIIINNKVVGHIALGSEYTYEPGYNLYLDSLLAVNYPKISFYFNGSELIMWNGSNRKVIDIPDGDVNIVAIDHFYSVVYFEVYGEENTLETTLCILKEDETVEIVSNKVLDCSFQNNDVTDILYFMEGDTVFGTWSPHDDDEPTVICDGAYAIASWGHLTYGAIVPKEMSNKVAGGYDNLYHP